jgi:hypothetical protein
MDEHNVQSDTSAPTSNFDQFAHQDVNPRDRFPTAGALTNLPGKRAFTAQATTAMMPIDVTP